MSIQWLNEAIRENKTGLVSSSRVIALAAGFTLCFCTLLLSIGSWWHTEMVSAVIALGPTLGLLAGANYYVANRPTKDGMTNDAPTNR